MCPTPTVFELVLVLAKSRLDPPLIKVQIGIALVKRSRHFMFTCGGSKRNPLIARARKCSYQVYLSLVLSQTRYSKCHTRVTSCRLQPSVCHMHLKSVEKKINFKILRSLSGSIYIVLWLK